MIAKLHPPSHQTPTDRSFASRIPVFVNVRDSGEITFEQTRCGRPVVVVLGPEQWPEFVEQLKAAQKAAASGVEQAEVAK